MYSRNIILVFLVHTFNLNSILCIVKYIIKSNIHNKKLKNGILFTDLCTKNFCNRHNYIKHSVEVCFTVLVSLLRRNEDLIKIINYEPSQAKASEGVLAERTRKFLLYACMESSTTYKILKNDHRDFG